jgi:hypothetical protein
MKCIFNEDGTMFLYAKGRDHADIPGKTSLEVPDDLNIHKVVQENNTSISIELTFSELQVRLAEYMSGYVNSRRSEYPSIEDQLDVLYHEGYEGWKAKISDVKSKYPKPE